MSVPEPLRHKGRFEVFVKAEALAYHTGMLLKNPNVFKPEVDADLISRIRNYAYDIYVDAMAANKLNAEGNAIERSERYRLQTEAILNCDRMHVSIGIAKNKFHLRKRKMNCWSRMIRETRALLVGWRESDVRRYGQP